MRVRQQDLVGEVAGLITTTPLLHIPSLSKQTNCEVGTCSMQHVHGTFPAFSACHFACLQQQHNCQHLASCSTHYSTG